MRTDGGIFGRRGSSQTTWYRVQGSEVERMFEKGYRAASIVRRVLRGLSGGDLEATLNLLGYYSPYIMYNPKNNLFVPCRILDNSLRLPGTQEFLGTLI